MKRPASASTASLKRPAVAKKPACPAVPAHVPILGCHPYVLCRADLPYSIPIEDGCFTGVEFDIHRLNQAGEVRAGRAPWGAAKVLHSFPDSDGRLDLQVQLWNNNHHFKSTYHRLVGLSLLQCWWDDQGQLLPEGYSVSVAFRDEFQVHHRSGDTWDVSLGNLAVVTKPCHRLCTAGYKLPEPRQGWGITSLL
jgi:hypothetical protein